MARSTVLVSIAMRPSSRKSGALAGPAAVARPARDNHLELGRDDVERLARLLADDMQRIATAGTSRALRRDDDLLARQVLGQIAAIAPARRGPALAVRLPGVGGVLRCLGHADRLLEILHAELQLIGIELLRAEMPCGQDRGRPKPTTPVRLPQSLGGGRTNLLGGNSAPRCALRSERMEFQMKQQGPGNGGDSPTYKPPQPSGLTPVLERNIEALYKRRQREAGAASWQERAADAIARFTGSIRFVYLHLLIFGFWIIANLHWIPGVPTWDESFVVLAMVASVEAIFLSTFVLITQNRMGAAADKRADLDLQISLLTEHEITKLTALVFDMADRMGVKADREQEIELQEVKQDIAPDAVLDKLEKKSTH
jgi:uncharacterized membrane protein